MGALESDVLALLWDSENPLTVREVLDGLNRNRITPLAYTTVMTVLVRLTEKGYLLRNQVGRAYAYSLAAPDEASLAVRRVLNEHGDKAVAQFLSAAEADTELQERLRRIVRRGS